MTTSFSKNLTGTSIRAKVRKFYDLGSPLYLDVYGKHIHDGYYITGKETKEEAQENLIKLMAEKARIKKHARILDVGCGMGGSSIWLAENFGAVTTGITISPVQMDIAKKSAQDRKAKSSFLLMNAENMHFPGTFDVIWVLAAMTHFQHQESFLKSTTNFLNKKGKFIIFDWMLCENTADLQNDQYIKPVSEGMLLASLHPMSAYLKWFMQYGYRVIYSEDITAHTIKTWDVALSVIKKPAVLKLAYRLTKEDIKEATRFFKSIRAMKLAMKKGMLIAGIIAAEKL
jgi:tocopherol O-methyltransferase